MNQAMRIAVVGGAGEVGRAVTEDLAAQSDVAEVIAIDRRQEDVEALAASLGPKVRPVVVDLDDTEAALELLRGVDVLMNCTSFMLFDRVIALAIAAGVAYGDLISEPTDPQRAAAAEAGITAISGLGASPGLTNILVRHAHADFERLDEVHVCGVSWRSMAPSPGLLDTILWELGEDCPTRQSFQNGSFRWAAPFEGSRVVELAQPIGRHRVYFVPHPETTTLPRNFPELRFCAVRASWRDELMDDVRVLNKYGLLDNVPAAHADGHSIHEVVKARIWEKIGGQRDEQPWALFTNLEVIGRLNGRMSLREYRITHPLEWGQESVGRQTGVCAAVQAQLMGRHGTTHAGFVDPEVYFDPEETLAELRRRGTVAVAWDERELADRPLERAVA
jgi:saccharopine dehydrogenase (NAD+, L-lysine-forming)